MITKTVPISKNDIETDPIKEVCNSVFDSLRRLKRKRIYGLLVHHCNDLVSDKGSELYESLSDLKSKGILSKLGVSVYSKDEIDFVLNYFDLDLIQIPMNVFDQRLLHSGTLKRLKKRDIEIHVRSAFLQGAVFMNPDELPNYLVNYSSHLARFQDTIKGLGISPAAACLAFLMQQQEIDKVICGVNSLLQLRELIESTMDLPFIRSNIFDSFVVEDDNFLNPSKWQE